MLNEDLIALCEQSTFGNDSITLKFKADTMRLKTIVPIELNKSVTDCVTFAVTCVGTDKTTGETVEMMYDLLYIPNIEDTFKLNGVDRQVIDAQRAASGWYVGKEKKAKHDVHFIRLKKSNQRGDMSSLLIQQVPKDSVKTDAGKRRRLMETEKRVPIMAQINFSGKIEGKKFVLTSLATFLRAFTDLDYSQLVEKIGRTEAILSALDTGALGEPTRVEALKTMYSAAFGSDKAEHMSADEIYRELFTKPLEETYYSLEPIALTRLKNISVFKSRAIGKTLSEPLNVFVQTGETVEEQTLPVDTTLTESLLDSIDRNDIDELKVHVEDKIYTLKKYSYFNFCGLGSILNEDAIDPITRETVVPKGTLLTSKVLDVLDSSNISMINVRNAKGDSTLTRRTELSHVDKNDLYLMLNIFFNAIEGYTYEDNEYSLANRKFVSFETIIYNRAVSDLQNLSKAILDKYASASGDLKLTAAMNAIDLQPDKLLKDYSGSDNGSSQASNLTNPLSIQMNCVKTDMPGENFGEAVRGISDMSYGRIDPMVTPESSKVGVVLYRTVVSDTNRNGEIVTPYIEMENGRPKSSEPVYISALQEKNNYIATFDTELWEIDENGNEVMKPWVFARYNDTTVKVHPSKIAYQDYSTFQNCCIARSLIPFRSCLAPKRQTMGSNHGMQAIPVVKLERPLVGTGSESLYSGWKVTAQEILDKYYEDSRLSEQGVDKAVFVKSTITLVEATDSLGSRKLGFTINAYPQYKIYRTIDFMKRNSKGTIYSKRVNNLVPGLMFSGDDIVFHEMCYQVSAGGEVDIYGSFGQQQLTQKELKSGLALGVNLTVAYKTYEGSTIEDSAVINADLIGNDILTSIELYKYEYKLLKETKEMREYFATYYEKGSTKTAHLPACGYPKVGTYLHSDSVVISRVRVETIDGKQEINPCYIEMSSTEEGEVIYSDIKDDTVTVIVANMHTVEEGDKITGRHGNKCIIGRIVPAKDMPFDDEGNVVDLILSPLGVPSRSNISQIFEAALGMAAKKRGRLCVVAGNVKPMELITQLDEAYDLKPRMLRDGRTGQYFKRPINVGVAYILKSEHMVAHKINTLGFPTRVDSITGQPLKGRAQKGGQALGEMELDVLRSMDCNKFLDDIMSFYSSDINGRDLLKKHIRNNPFQVSLEGKNDNNRFMEALFKPLGFRVDIEDGAYKYRFLRDTDVLALSPQELDLEEPRKSLRDPAIFGTSKVLLKRMELREKWGYIDLGCKMINPTFLRTNILSKLVVYPSGVGEYEHLSQTKINRLLDEKAFLKMNRTPGGAVFSILDEPGSGTLTGIDAIVCILEEVTVDHAIDCYKDELEKITNSLDKPIENLSAKELAKLTEAQELLSNVQAFKDSGQTFKDAVITKYPVLPIIYRPEPTHGRYQDYDEYYNDIMRSVTWNKNKGTPSTRKGIFQAIAKFTGISTADGTVEGRTPLVTKFTGTYRDGATQTKDAHGDIRENLGRRRIIGASRSVIKPSWDPAMDLMHVGLPVLMCVTMWEVHLCAWFNNMYNTHDNGEIKDPDLTMKVWKEYLVGIASGKIDNLNCMEYRPFKVDQSLTPYKVKSVIRMFIEGDADKGIPPCVCLFGRQPSLHPHSGRGFYIKVTEGKAISIHPLACPGFNADFDGDQMFVAAVFDEAAKKEIIEKMSYQGHLITEKDCSVLVQPTQDILSGCYIGTMLKNNVTNIAECPEEYDLSNTHFYTSVRAMVEDIRYGNLEWYALVCLRVGDRKYLSTAGRIWFNSIMPGGLSKEPFTNPLGFPNQEAGDANGIKLSNYYDLKYDGLLAKSGSSRYGMKYVSTTTVCQELADTTEATESEKIKVLQDMVNYGYYFSDVYGLTLSFVDLEINPKREIYVERAKNASELLEADFNAGLLSGKAYKAAKIEVNNYCSDTFSGVLLDELSRTNNLFILLDSGARGNKTQLNQTLGIIGMLAKSKTEKIDTPIYSNFALGLSEAEQFNTSYGGRMGIHSTQNETSVTGEVLRSSSFSASTLPIVEEDCGRELHAPDMFIKLRYTDLRSVRMAMADESKELWERDIIDIKLEDLTGYTLADNDEQTMLHLAKFIEDGKLTKDALSIIQKKKIKKLVFNEGTVTLRYKLDEMSKSELLYREAYGLPNLIDGQYISQDSIKYIEDNNLEDIRVRTLLACRSVNGICAKCYGLTYRDRQLPPVGSNVAMVSAMAIGEPASQLTLDLVHSLGTKGGNLSSGVSFLKSLQAATTDSLGSFVYNGESGYATVKTTGKYSRISIAGSPSTLLSSSSVAIQDGEYVEKYTPLTKGLADPNQIGTGITLEEIMLRQFEMMKLYYDTYASNGIRVMGRHFEVMARAQGSVAVALEDSGEFKAGFEYNLFKLVRAGVPFCAKIVSVDNAVFVNGGVLTAISKSNTRRALERAVLTDKRDENISCKGKTTAGESMVHEGRVSLAIERDLGDSNIRLRGRRKLEEQPSSKSGRTSKLAAATSRRPGSKPTLTRPTVLVDEKPANILEDMLTLDTMDLQQVSTEDTSRVTEENNVVKSENMDLFGK